MLLGSTRGRSYHHTMTSCRHDVLLMLLVFIREDLTWNDEGQSFFFKTFISDRNAYLNKYDSEFIHHNLCIDCEEFIDNIVTEINSTICSMTYPSLIDISSHFSKSLTSLICTQYFFYLVNMITSSFIPHTFPNTTI